jgi:hypothetical protein
VLQDLMKLKESKSVAGFSDLHVAEGLAPE